MSKERRPSAEAFWQSFADATGTEASYEAWAFGGDDTPELATELGLLVRDGPKRATTITLSSFEMDGDPLPEVDGYWMVLDGAGDRSEANSVTPFRYSNACDRITLEAGANDQITVPEAEPSTKRR